MQFKHPVLLNREGICFTRQLYHNVVGTKSPWKGFYHKPFRGTRVGEVQHSRCQGKERFSDVRDAGVKRKHVNTA